MAEIEEGALEAAAETVFSLIRHEASWGTSSMSNDANANCREVSKRVARALLSSQPPTGRGGGEERLREALRAMKLRTQATSYRMGEDLVKMIDEALSPSPPKREGNREDKS